MKVGSIRPCYRNTHYYGIMAEIYDAILACAKPRNDAIGPRLTPLDNVTGDVDNSATISLDQAEDRTLGLIQAFHIIREYECRSTSRHTVTFRRLPNRRSL